jgi:CspA family cold shock protein
VPVGRVKWFSLEKGFGFISNEEGEDVYLPASSLPAGMGAIKPGAKLEFSILDGRRGPQAHGVKVLEEPVSVVANTRMRADDLATIIEDTIKLLDKVGNGLRHGRYPSGPEGERLARVLNGIASQLNG